MSAISEDNCDLHLHAEIEMLKNSIVEKQTQIMAMETAVLQEHDRQVELEDSIIAWQDKYDRLYESHKRVQKVNQNLEDKLLKLVDRNSGERAQLTSDVATLSVRLAQANYTIAHLQREIERYKADMGLAIQLLQCKPDSFVPQKITSLPIEIQSKVANYMRLDTNSHSDSEGSTSGVGIATTNSYSVVPASDSPPLMCPFPPTAMVYSMRGIDNKVDSPPSNSSQQQLLPKSNGNSGSATATPNNTNNSNHFHVTPSTMAKFLEDELKSSDIKHCITCNCTIKEITAILAERPKTFSIGTQTVMNGNNTNNTNSNSNSLCLRCTSNLNSPSTTAANSPFVMKLYKSNDSIVSDTKSNLSKTGNKAASTVFSGDDYPSTVPIVSIAAATIAKKDDLTVNPLLVHHRLCDRTDVNLVTTTTATATPLLHKSNEIISNNNNNNVSNSNNSSNNSNINIETTKLLIRPSTSELSNNSNSANNSININNNNNNKNVESSSIPTQENGNNNNGSIISDENGTVNKGSNNSLWSKSSNTASEAAKMFENFNLNLIKTIKAENPKMSGPRLCALRIPSNGSNNILLDNLEPTLSPIVYRRRSKFLDEELSDTKEVILTTSTPTTTNQPKSSLSAIQTNVLLHTINSNGSVITEQPTNHLNSHIAILTLNDSVAGGGDGSVVIPGEISDNKTDSEKFREAQTQQQSVTMPEINQIYMNVATDKLIKNESVQSTTNNNNTIIMSSKEPDDELKECVLLRRQQLNRVAEWVQNSNNNNNNSEDTEPGLDDITNENICDDISNMSNVDSISSNNYSIGGEINLNNLKSNFNTTKDSSITSSTKLSLSASLCDDKKYIKTSPNAQNTNNNNSSSRNHTINNNNNSNEKCSSPDIAQMEYNVRQFLLKQNEWSIHNKLSTATTAKLPSTPQAIPTAITAAVCQNDHLGTPAAIGATSKGHVKSSSAQSSQVLNNIIFRTETNL